MKFLIVIVVAAISGAICGKIFFGQYHMIKRKWEIAMYIIVFIVTFLVSAFIRIQFLGGAPDKTACCRLG